MRHVTRVQPGSDFGEMSNETSGYPGCLGNIGDDILPSQYGDRDYFINRDIRIPIKQPGFNGSSIRGFIFMAQLSWLFNQPPPNVPPPRNKGLIRPY